MVKASATKSCGGFFVPVPLPQKSKTQPAAWGDARKKRQGMENIPAYMNRRGFRVVVPHGVQKELAEWFGVHKSFVSLVLKQEKSGRLAKEIIARALKRGGYWEHK